MKKNLRFLQSLIIVKKQNYFRNLLFVISCFISAQLFSQNPALVKDILPNSLSSYIQKIVTTTAGKTFFNTLDNNNHFSALWGLWTTDGTQSGTVKLSLSDGHYITTEATLLTPLGNNKIVFAGDNEQGYGEVWVSDGTQVGTFGLENFITGASGAPVTNIASLGSIDVYSAIMADNHLQLRKTDGTIAGTALVYDFGLYTDYSLSYFKTIGNIVYFELNNPASSTHNFIWRTDGTTAGTYQVKDLGMDYGFASDFMSFNNNIYFITISSTYGDYIWKSDGTTVGTVPLKQISATFNQDNVYPYYAATNDELYFVANDGVSGKELWKTDGTVGGTGIAADVNTGSGSSNPIWLTALNGIVYFSATTPATGFELWKFDINSGQGAVMVKDIFPGSTSSDPASLSVQNNVLLFNAFRDNNEGIELWISDGTSANTLELADLTSTIYASTAPYLFSGNGSNVFFTGFTNNGDRAIYKFTMPEKIWTGNVSTDASNGSNWFPVGAPASTDNVLFPVNPLNSFSGSFFQCKDFINNGSTINITSGFCFISGVFYNAGTINNSALLSVTSDGTNNLRSIGSPGIFNGQFSLGGGLTVGLSAPMTVTSLNVSANDTFFLGTNNLQANAFDYQIPKIITDSSGSFLMPVGASPVTFPVSADVNSYNPAVISNSGTSDYFGVNVSNGIYTNGTSGNLVLQQAINKTWNIYELTPGGSNANITLQWSASDELMGFDRNNVYLNHYTSGAWDSGTPGVASGSDPYSFTRTGFTSFSPFSISSATGVLPVNLISFSANKINNTVELNWQIASEKNISFYNVERSKDGNSFESLNQLKASGINYSYVDQQPLAGTDFYRLKMIDGDGKFTYSKVVAIKMDSRNVRLQIFPNPAKNILNIQVNGYSEKALLQIIDIAGRKVKEEKISLSGNTSVSVDVNNLQKGTYNLLIKGNSINEQKKFVKE